MTIDEMLSLLEAETADEGGALSYEAWKLRKIAAKVRAGEALAAVVRKIEENLIQNPDISAISLVDELRLYFKLSDYEAAGKDDFAEKFLDFNRKAFKGEDVDHLVEDLNKSYLDLKNRSDGH